MSICIESEHLVLRQFTEADLPALVKIAGQAHILLWCRDWADCAEWVHDWFKAIAWRYTIADPNKEFILLAIIEKSTNATEAAKAMMRHFSPVNPNNFFYALIDPANAASLRVAEKTGFRFVSEITIKDAETGEARFLHYYRSEREE